MTRRSLLRAGLTGCLVAPWWHALRAFAARPVEPPTASGVTDTEIILGMSAAFSGSSRGLGIELYRGAGAYFTHVNQQGGVASRTLRVKAYDDGYQPGPSVKNTMKLMLDDQVFLLFGYVGTPTVTRVLPILKKFQDQNILLFFPFTGAQPQREPPYGAFAFNLRASYRQETAGLVDNFMRINRRRIAVFYQADAYGRSGWAGVRSALKKHGEQIVGEATYRRGERFTGTMRKQVEILKAAKPEAVICIGAYAALCGLCPRCRRSRPTGALCQPILRRQRKSPQAAHRGARRQPALYAMAGKLPSGAQLRRHLHTRGARVPQLDEPLCPAAARGPVARLLYAL